MGLLFLSNYDILTLKFLTHFKLGLYKFVVNHISAVLNVMILEYYHIYYTGYAINDKLIANY